MQTNRQQADLAAGKTELSEFDFQVNCGSATIDGLMALIRGELINSFKENGINPCHAEEIKLDVFIEVES